MTDENGHGAPLVRVRSANERFRSHWDAQLGWGTLIAAVVHLGAFVLSPTWDAPVSLFESAPAEANGLLVVPLAGELFGPVAAPVVVPPPLGAPESVSEDVDGPLQGPIVTGSEIDEVWAALGDRLGRRGGLLPTLVEPIDGGRPYEEDEPAEEQEVQEALVDELALAELEGGLPQPDSLSLARLSELRPELAFMTASAWVLLRNQDEVEAYLARGYREGTVDSSLEGSVSVTLWIDRRGTVEWAEVTNSSGHSSLDEFALRLFNEIAEFRAAREGGSSIARSVTFSLNFPW